MQTFYLVSITIRVTIESKILNVIDDEAEQFLICGDRIGGLKGNFKS
jgi:hypothetical protein